MCVRGIVNEEIDEEGWEYSGAFSNFSVASLRRTYKNMDVVRRRRWVRTRASKAFGKFEKGEGQGQGEGEGESHGSIRARARPLILHWDVQNLKNGTRSVHIRSGMQFKNDMPFPVILVLSYNSWENDQELGPVKEGDILSVPLLCACASSMMIRPAEGKYCLSKPVPCAIQTYDFKATSDVICASAGASHESSIAQTQICMRFIVSQSNRSVLITAMPYITIENRMPCDLHYRVSTTSQDQDQDRNNTNTNTKNKTKKSQESGELLSGSRIKITHLNLNNKPSLSVCMASNFVWSAALLLPQPAAGEDRRNQKKSSGRDDYVQIELPNSNGTGIDQKDNGIVLCMKTELNENFNLEVFLYSKYVLIDRTQLGLSVWSQKNYGQEMLRHTFVPDNAGTPTASSRAPRRLSVQAKNKKIQDFQDSRKEAARSNKSEKAMVDLQKTGFSVEEVDSDLIKCNCEDSGFASATASAIGGRGGADGGPMMDQSPQSDTGTIAGVAAPGSVINFIVDSNNSYQLCTATNADFVYSDRQFIWSHLPEPLRDNWYVHNI